MDFSSLLPADETIAALLGVSWYWDEIVPYLDLFGHLVWYCLGALLMLLAMVLPRGPFFAPLIAALTTGVLVKLAEVYAWGRISYLEQLIIFVAIALAIGAGRAVLHRRRHGVVFSE